MKNDFKNKAIKLRQEGLTYSQILIKIPVAKSTLSSWLRGVGLSKRQKQAITQKRLKAARRGAQMRKNWRLENSLKIKNQSLLDIGKINKRDLFLIGVALYWAEGSKEKDYRVGSGVHFTNMDPRMVKIFLEWLRVICQVSSDDLVFGLYLHHSQKERKEEIIRFWSKVANLPKTNFTRVYFKKGNSKTLRKNKGKTYFGTLRVSVRRSSFLNRKIDGWVEGVINNIRA